MSFDHKNSGHPLLMSSNGFNHLRLTPLLPPGKLRSVMMDKYSLPICQTQSSERLCCSCSKQSSHDGQHRDNATLSCAGVLLYLLYVPVVKLAVMASMLPLISLILVLPALWLMFGFTACLGTAVLKKLIMPAVHNGKPIQLWSLAFFRWWLVHRMISLTNQLFVQHLRGSVFVATWFRALVHISFLYFILPYLDLWPTANVCWPVSSAQVLILLAPNSRSTAGPPPLERSAPYSFFIQVTASL